MRQEEISFTFAQAAAQAAGGNLKMDPSAQTVGMFGPGGIPGPVLDNCLTMNQQCKVCGEPAAGFHFGAFTCEGCKSFFGRTYNNLGSISECKNQGTCVINKKNRTSCKACRLRKCLLVGMSKSGSRYGRRSNWFKIHCLLQQQSQSQGPTPTPATAFYPGAFLHSPFLGTPTGGAGMPEFAHREPETKEERSGSSHSEYSAASSAGDNDHDSSRLGSPSTFLRPPSSHQTPSPFSEPELSHPRKFAPDALRSPTSPTAFSSPPFPGSLSGRVLFPPPSIQSVTRPGLTPSLMFLDPGCPPRSGGDLGLASPALAGVAEEQDQPIDLSVKGSAVTARTSPPASPLQKVSDSRSEAEEDAKDMKEGVRVSTPLDLTSKRGIDAPQSG